MASKKWEKMAERSFAIWLHKDRAVICDRDVPLEEGCRVCWVENRWGCGEGTLLTKDPHKARRLTIELDDQSEGVDPFVTVRKTDVVKIVGEYNVLHPAGGDRGAERALYLLRPMLVLGPLGTGKPLPALPCQ
jgi:hypothetical protein